jgi:cytochrome c biogenesis protein CcmG/thiol:disulfide interchange protein DsbE
VSVAENKPVASGRRRILLAVLPFVVFVGFVVIAYALLSKRDRDPEFIPSALIGKPAPDFDLPPLEGLTADNQPVPGLKKADLLGHVTLVNVFASWCGPCRVEHPALLELAKDKRFRLVAINYKDRPENARRFLEDLGNPFAAIGVDAHGRTGIDWGVYGVPETFVVGPDGIIRYKLVGEVSEESFTKVLEPEIKKALSSAAYAPAIGRIAN